MATSVATNRSRDCKGAVGASLPPTASLRSRLCSVSEPRALASATQGRTPDVTLAHARGSVGSGIGLRLLPATRGSALLSVLWLVAALSAIALAIATSVRGETDRASTGVDSVRAHYLAVGALQRVLLRLEWGPQYATWNTPVLFLDFPTGNAEVRIVPESSKLNANLAKPEELVNLMLALGVDPERAQAIAAAIVEWRTPMGPGSPPVLAPYNFAPGSSFQPRHASLEEIEDLLLVRGMTPELFYGGYRRDESGRLFPTSGLKDCLTVYAAGGGVDANSADPAVLATIGLSPDLIAALVEARSRTPFRGRDDLRAVVGADPAAVRLTVGGSAAYMLRATARVRLPNGELSSARSSAAALVRLLDTQQSSEPYHVLRWYDNVWVQ